MNRPARRRSSYKTISSQDQQQSQPTTTNTASAMDGANRKIELQSPEDLTYLINNVRRAAAEHITAAFPPVDDADGEEDELRVRIEQLVEEYISQTFTLSAPNLSINGFDLDASTFPAVYLADPSKSNNNNNNKRKTRKQHQQELQPEVQYEPFDARKRARVEELARQEEDLMREIAALKRKLPGAAAQGYNEGFWDGVRKDEVALAEMREQALREITGGGGGGDDDDDDHAEAEAAEQETESASSNNNNKKRKHKVLDGLNGPLERQAEVQKTYAGVVDTLGRLKREMPATVAKMERARVAGEYVVTER